MHIDSRNFTLNLKSFVQEVCSSECILLYTVLRRNRFTQLINEFTVFPSPLPLTLKNLFIWNTYLNSYKSSISLIYKIVYTSCEQSERKRGLYHFFSKIMNKTEIYQNYKLIYSGDVMVRRMSLRFWLFCVSLGKLQ